MAYFPLRRYYRPLSRASVRRGCVPGGRAVIDWERETEDGIEVYRIEGTVSDYDPGVTSGPVDRCYPPEGGEVEIDTVYRIDDDGNETEVENYDFSSKEMREIESRMADSVEQYEPDPPDPYDD